MRFRALAAGAGLAIFLFSNAGKLAAQKRRSNEQQKVQIQPLPPEPPMALAADSDSLDFHISPLLKSGGLAAQIRQSLNDLIRDTRGETIVKLRAFVAGSGDARRVQAQMIDLFSDHKLPLPALTILKIGGFGTEATQIVVEAVVSTHRSVNPNGLAFFFNQRGGTLEKALQQFKANTVAAGVPADHLLTCTCFTSHIDNYEEASKSASALFPRAGLNMIQAVRDPMNDTSTCEGVGQLSQAPSAGPVVLMEFAHVTLVHSQQLIFTGMQLSFGNFLDDAQQAFGRLTRAAAALQAVETPVEVNGYALDPSAAAALRKTISLAPGTFTVGNVEGLPSIDASAGIEAVMAPNVQSAVVLTRQGPKGTIFPE